MLLELTTTHKPATDLGYLLHKHPDRVQEFSLSAGTARVFYPEATEDRCSCALLVEIDSVGLVRRRGGGWSLAEYVNDRPYVASSHLAVAIGKVFSSAMKGRCEPRQALADAAIPLEARIPVVRCRGGLGLIKRLFEPLGYEVAAESIPLEPDRKSEGSPLVDLRLSATIRLADLLTHLYVLIPVMDDAIHFWVDQGEIDKLIARGEGWLNAHPERNLIVHRALRHQRKLSREALERLVNADGADEEDEDDVVAEPEDVIEQPIRLVDARMGTTMAVLRASNVKRVVDLGCGEGRLLELLLKNRSFDAVLGVDVSSQVLGKAESRLKLDRKPDTVRERIRLIQGSVLYRDERLAGYDAICALEVIEHLDPPRLAAFERVVFEFARPRMVLISTPNSEYNGQWETLPAGDFRHPDHRFEWTRSEFEGWATPVAGRHRYGVRFLTIGDIDPNVGSPTQMAVFELAEQADD